MTTGPWSRRAARRWQREHAIPFTAAARFVAHDAAVWRTTPDHERLERWRSAADATLDAMRPSLLWNGGPLQPIPFDGLLQALLREDVTDLARLAELLPIMVVVVDDLPGLRIPAPLIDAARTEWRTCHAALVALTDHLSPIVAALDRAIGTLVAGGEPSATDLNTVADAVNASLTIAVPVAERMGDRLLAILHDASPQRDLCDILLVAWDPISLTLEIMWHCSRRLNVLSGRAVGQPRPYGPPRFMRAIEWGEHDE